MKRKTPHDVVILDDDMLLLSSPSYDLSQSGQSDKYKNEMSADSSTLIQSILDKMYKRENEMPYLFLQWVD